MYKLTFTISIPRTLDEQLSGRKSITSGLLYHRTSVVGRFETNAATTAQHVREKYDWNFNADRTYLERHAIHPSAKIPKGEERCQHTSIATRR